MSNRSIVVEYMANHHYDIRETHNARWIDQKCTFDVLNFIADCVIEYLGNRHYLPFTKDDIWHSDYASTQVQAIFSKPDAFDREAFDEFQKFFRQPLKLLAAAEVLKEIGRKGRSIVFMVEDYEMLSYIANRDYKALEFLTAYIMKVLDDSGLTPYFDNFFENQNNTSLRSLRKVYYGFCREYTPIRTTTESNRIFVKVLNPLAFDKHLYGTENGVLTRQVITRDKLVYNRANWRDVLAGKNKNVPRRGYVPPSGVDTSLDSKVNEAKRLVKQFNDTWRGSKSEVADDFGLAEKANAAHHIFPQWMCSELAAYPENLSVLTTAQHMGRAHPNGNTLEVDQSYQKLCLLSKLRIIKANIEGDLGDKIIYSLDRFIYVLDVGLETDGYFERLTSNDYGLIETHLDLFL